MSLLNKKTFKNVGLSTITLFAITMMMEKISRLMFAVIVYTDYFNPWTLVSFELNLIYLRVEIAQET